MKSDALYQHPARVFLHSYAKAFQVFSANNTQINRRLLNTLKSLQQEIAFWCPVYTGILLYSPHSHVQIMVGPHSWCYGQCRLCGLYLGYHALFFLSTLKICLPGNNTGVMNMKAVVIVFNADGWFALTMMWLLCVLGDEPKERGFLWPQGIVSWNTLWAVWAPGCLWDKNVCYACETLISIQ